MTIKPGEVFYAYNSYMTPQKPKYHVCINDKTYLIINTKPARFFNCTLTKHECNILDYDSNINCSLPMTQPPISSFAPEKQVMLPASTLSRIMNTVRVATTISPFQQKIIIKDLQRCIDSLNK